MEIYRMNFEQLAVAIKQAMRIANRNSARHPEAAALIFDAVELGLKELLTNVVNGDRKLAQKIYASMPSTDH